MPLTHIDLIGYAAAVCTTLAFVPQVLKIHRERSAYDISTGMYVVYIAGVGLWLAYGVLVASWPIILANAATICLAMAVLWMKWRFTRSAPRPRHSGTTHSGTTKTSETYASTARSVITRPKPT